jgi:hypothetical protein
VHITGWRSPRLHRLQFVVVVVVAVAVAVVTASAAVFFNTNITENYLFNISQSVIGPC